MRRNDREIKELKGMVEILDTCEIAHIGFTDKDGLPYVVPVNFGFDVIDGALTLYFHGAKAGKKAELLQLGPSVAVCIYRGLGMLAGERACDYGYAYESVMAFGKATVVADTAQRLHGLDMIMKKATDKMLPYDEALLLRTEVFAVAVDTWSAKRRPLK